MDQTRNRSLLFATACVLGAAAFGTACSADVESVSSTGTASADAGVQRSAPSSLPGTSAPRPADADAAVSSADPATSATSATSVTTDPPPLPPSSAMTGPTFNTTTTIVDPDQPPPPPPETSTIPASGQDPALLDCGILYRASGWPTTFVPSTEAIACLQGAFDAGTPARLVDRAQTDGEGGAILVTTYDVLGAGVVRVTVDARQAADRPQGITVSRCTGLASEFVTITTSGCTVIG